ncbi:hypothetical protein BH20CHL3_BH20CHL3_13770 [soil metagenome]
MGRYGINRLAAAIPTLILLTPAAFLLNSAARSDPATNALRAGGQDPTPPAIAAYREQLGLEDLGILDIVNYAAFFANANRLMLTLGEPVRKVSQSAPQSVQRIASQEAGALVSRNERSRVHQ